MKHLLILLIAGCLFSACKKDKAITPADQQNTLTGSAKNEGAHRPFKGTYTTTAQVLQPPPVLKQKITGTGQATHLGESSFVAYATILIQPPPPFAITGTATFIAANSDEFYTKFTGTSTPNGNGTSTGVLRHIVTGGTGRFADATGDFTGVSIINAALPTNSVTYDGWINY